MTPVEQIKARLNIVDVVSSYIKLQKAGINLKACCPFHNEKTPSFFVSPARESWHCFGCGKGGDIFSFVMEIEGVEFLEALRTLAAKAGVELVSGPVNIKEKSEREQLFQEMNEAKSFYENELKKNNDVIAYLKERGLKEETIASFGIGFAPDPKVGGWRNLYSFLKTKKYSDEQMEKAGLIIKSQTTNSKSQSQNFYDRFRGRIMFPLFNAMGQTVGFSARIFGEETEKTGGKYINSPQTELYDKSRLLYGFDRAKTEIRRHDTCVLVEGQMDVIMSHQAGVLNAVAVSGTSLTEEHLNIIKRLTENLIMSFDKDKAGALAAKRGIDLALIAGFEVKVAVAPIGKDPADTVKENPEAWVKEIESAKNIIEFFLGSAKDKKEVFESVLPYIAILPSEINRAHWVKETAKKLGVKEDAVWEDLKKIKVASYQSPAGIVSETPPGQQSKSREHKLKERLLGIIFWKKDAKDTETENNKELKDEIDKFVDSRKIDLNDPKILKIKERIIFEAEANFHEAESLANEFKILVTELEKEEIKNELTETADAIRKIEAEGDRGKEKELEENLNKFYKLAKKLNEIK